VVGVVSARRITIVSAQLLGFDRTGGVGAATTFLAIALARLGHEVDVLYAQEQPIAPMDVDWARRYDEAGVEIRQLPPLDVPIEPRHFRRMRAVEAVLRSDPPDVVIAHEYGAPVYAALRLRQLGLGFENTLFVAYCHGTARWVKEITRNERVSADALALALLEQEGVELADLVVSPSAYLIDWMRGHGWRLPEARVIPLVTRATALGEAPAAVDRNGDARVERLVFFGRLEKRKGVEPFVAGLNALPPELLQRIELEFLGRTTKYWDPERVDALFAEQTRQALRRVTFETELDQQEALARLARPGTLAVIPSLAENSPNVVYECLEARVPFLASAGGGTGELVAEEDRPRVLFEPTADGVAAALQRALAADDALRPSRPSFERSEVVRAWADIVATVVRAPAPPPPTAPVDVIVHEHESPEALERCLTALARQSYERVRVIRSRARSVVDARDEGLRDSAAEWIVFLDEQDVPAAELVEVLVRAQAASGADVVSCGIRRDSCEHFFAGEPGGLGLLANGYGTVALLRRALLDDVATEWPVAGDPDWPLLARLSALGARVVSVPLPLVRRAARPGALERDPSDALLVVEALERAMPGQLRMIARLATGLAAEAQGEQPAPAAGLRPRLRRLVGRLA
jgi:glycosyltransferase involved in cell wall biosynthesis